MNNKELKLDISNIFQKALHGKNKRYRDYENGIIYIRWGLIEEDICKAIDRHLIKGKKVNGKKT